MFTRNAKLGSENHLRLVTGHKDDRPRTPSDGVTRIALYSHDTQGLGHIRRNLLIAKALSDNGDPAIILLLSGLRETTAFAMPPGVDCLTLPSLAKSLQGQYTSRSLGVSLDELINMRSSAIAGALASFDPDVVIVDKVPGGAFDELIPALQAMRAGERARVVLGLRDILDEPRVVEREWRNGGYDALIRTYFDRIWIYGDRSVYDAVGEYNFAPDVAAKVRYSGYLNVRDVGDDGVTCPVNATEGPRMLCLVGGGSDGVPLAEAFLDSALPEGSTGLLVTGPLMPLEARAALRARMSDRFELLEFVTNPCPLIEQADRVIAMGGYNTVCEVLSYDKPALIVPRVRPRTEQLIRASRLAAMGVVDMLHPDDLSSFALSSWLSGADERRPPRDSDIDFSGVARLPRLLEEVRASSRHGEEQMRAAQ